MSDLDPSGTHLLQVPSRADRKIAFDCLELELVAGPDAGLCSRLPLTSAAIGTAPDNDVVLTDRTVSRHHAKIIVTSDGILFRDLGSTNGTFLNQLRLVKAYITAGATLSLGKSEIRIRQTTEERSYETSDAERLGGLVLQSGQRLRLVQGMGNG